MPGRSTFQVSDRSQPHFMKSTNASRGQKSVSLNFAAPILTPSPSSRGRDLVKRAKQRIVSFGSSKKKGNLLSSNSTTRKSSLRLHSPTRRTSHIPEPVKKESESSIEKPLPSLPIARLVTRSPKQRRSLIDATDLPLRASLSPGIFVDWPTLSPTRNYEKIGRQPLREMSDTPTKPSLGESVIERMRKLNIDEEQRSHLPRMTSKSKADAQDYTPRRNSQPHINDTLTGYNEGENHEYLNPRQAPSAPKNTPIRTPSNSRTGRQNSLRALNVTKTRKNISKADIITPQQSFRNAEGHRSNTRPQNVAKAAATPSSIPRPSQTTGKRDSLSSNLSNFPPTSPKVVRLKHAQGQIFDLVNNPSATSTDERVGSNDLKHSTGRRSTSSQQQQNGQVSMSRPSTRESDTTILSTWAMRDPDNPDKNSRDRSDSSAATTVQNSIYASPIGTPTRHLSCKENVPLSDEMKENVSPVKSFKFPTMSDNDDAQSTMTRATSVSSISKAGTIYAQDENGPYRLKPVSENNPQHGPQLRIDHSADKLFLTDEDLATVNAKREAYEVKTRSAHIDAAEVPELSALRASLRLVNEDTAPAIQLTTIAKAADTSIPPTWLHETHNSLSRHNDRLAPSVPTDIPHLTHSPDGWPLLESKVAPFAEVDQQISKRKSASESDLKVPNTPQQNRLSVVDEAPASAYTIRAALAHLDREDKEKDHNSSPKARKSLPNIPGHSKPLPSRPDTKPKSNSKEELKVKKRISKDGPSLKKQTSDILRSYVSQRAHAKPVTPSTQYMRSYSSSARQQDSQNFGNLPSSPTLNSGTVPSGKAKMMNHVKGLFHKTSREASLTHKSSRSSAIHSHSSIKSSPLAKSPTTPDMIRNARKPSLRTSSRHRLQERVQAERKRESGEPFQTSALEPAEIRDATALAFKLLDKARASDPRRDEVHGKGVEEIRAAEKSREEYVELARGLVAIVTLARDAEKAMEEAKAAAAKAEIEVMRCRENVGDVCGIVEKMLR